MPKKLGSILWHQTVNFFDDHKRETLMTNPELKDFQS
jgi:hypothetical protein